MGIIGLLIINYKKNEIIAISIDECNLYFDYYMQIYFSKQIFNHFCIL